MLVRLWGDKQVARLQQKCGPAGPPQRGLCQRAVIELRLACDPPLCVQQPPTRRARACGGMYKDSVHVALIIQTSVKATNRPATA